ncbi:MAG: hypothetical protein LBI20_03160 [Holosporales bacterium]|jgi:hypothetical protein|nr:hypothetical protein [Holosporales bacterium]
MPIHISSLKKLLVVLGLLVTAPANSMMQAPHPRSLPPGDPVALDLLGMTELDLLGMTERKLTDLRDQQARSRLTFETYGAGLPVKTQRVLEHIYSSTRPPTLDIDLVAKVFGVYQDSSEEELCIKNPATRKVAMQVLQAAKLPSTCLILVIQEIMKQNQVKPGFKPDWEKYSEILPNRHMTLQEKFDILAQIEQVQYCKTQETLALQSSPE